MKYLKGHLGTPHRFKLGHIRHFDGERAILIRYTTAGRPQYRKADGTTIVVHERLRRSQRVVRGSQEYFVG
jgi:hypothetical protein